MNINEYEIKINHLYDLLLDKLKYKKDINSDSNNLDKEINYKKKYNDLEKKYDNLEKKYNDLEKKLDNTIFHTNLLAIPHLNNDNNLSNYIFKEKFGLLSNSDYKKKDINNKIISGCIDLYKLISKNELIIKTKKQIKNQINFVILTLFNKEMLINSYSFNYFLKVKKIDNQTIKVINDFDYKLLFEVCNNKKNNNSEIKLYFFRVDELYNILH